MVEKHPSKVDVSVWLNTDKTLDFVLMVEGVVDDLGGVHVVFNEEQREQAEVFLRDAKKEVSPTLPPKKKRGRPPKQKPLTTVDSSGIIQE